MILARGEGTVRAKAARPAGRAALGLALLLAAGGAAAGQEALVAPSGLSLSWVDMIRDAPGPAGLTLRFRFLAPDMARIAADAAALSDDMQWLCESFALPRIASIGPQPAQIVISISDRPVPFGEPDPDALQVFEAYAPRPDGHCEWEMF